MWENSTITFLDALLFFALTYFILYVSGHCFLRLINRKDIAGFDLYQMINCKLFFGMPFLFIFLEVCSLFGLPILVGSWLLVGIVVTFFILYMYQNQMLCYHIMRDRMQNFRLSWRTVRDSLPSLTTLTALIVVNFISIVTIVGFYGSGNDDAAFHTFLIRVLLDNPQGLLSGTTMPYAEFYHTYPLASHALGAFLKTIFFVDIQKIVLMVTAIFPGLIVLAFYSSAKSLFKNRSFAALVSLVSIPSPHLWGQMAWGGLPTSLSLYISVANIGLIFILLSGRLDKRKAFLLGTIFLITICTYPVALLFTICWVIICLSFKLIDSRSVFKLFTILCKKIVVFLAMLAPLCFALPYLLNLYNLFFVFSNSNYPTDLPFQLIKSSAINSAQMIKQLVDFNWIIDIPRLAEFFYVRFGKLYSLGSFSLFIILILVCTKYLKGSCYSSRQRNFDKPLTMMYFLFLFIMFYLAFLGGEQFVFLLPEIFSPGRVFEMIFIPGVILSSAVLYSFMLSFRFLSKICKNSFVKSNHVHPTRLTSRRAHLVYPLLMVLTLGLNVYAAPLVAMSFQDFQENLGFNNNELYRLNSLNHDDISLMLYIKDNIPLNATLLVTAGDSGQYVSSVSQRKTIYGYDFRMFSQGYDYLVAQLGSCPFNLDLIPLLLDYNISHIFIGSKATTYSLEDPWRTHFNASKFLAVPYFKLVKRIGDAWLFRFDQKLAMWMINEVKRLDKVYYFDDRYWVSHVLNLSAISTFLENHAFRRLDADELRSWMIMHISQHTAHESTLVMTMGVVPDTVAEELCSDTTVRMYLNEGGRIVWIGDVPFFYQGHRDKTLSTWANNGSLTIIGVGFEYWDFNATASSLTMDGIRWGMTTPDLMTSRPVWEAEITTTLSEIVAEGRNYASSWHKNFNDTFPHSGFIRYSSQPYTGSDENNNRDILNLAIIPYLLDKMFQSDYYRMHGADQENLILNK